MTVAERRCKGGFTLIELMMVVAIVAVLAMVGTPSFREMLLNQRLTAVAQAFNSALSLARMEAIQRAQSVKVTALAGNGWSGGWATTRRSCVRTAMRSRRSTRWSTGCTSAPRS